MRFLGVFVDNRRLRIGLKLRAGDGPKKLLVPVRRSEWEHTKGSLH